MPFQATQIRVPIEAGAICGRDQDGTAGIEQHGVERVGGGDVLARVRMRHHGQIREARKLRHQILLPPRYGGEAGRGVIGAGPRIRDNHLMLACEPFEHGADGVGAIAALFLGRGHHLLDHRPRQTLTGERRDIPRVHAHMQRADMRVPQPRSHERGAQGGFARGGPC